MALEWSSEALAAVERIRDRVALFAGRDAADRWLRRVQRRLELAEALPFASRKVPEFDIEAVREVFADEYRVLYLVVPGGIEVITVFHGAMSLE